MTAAPVILCGFAGILVGLFVNVIVRRVPEPLARRPRVRAPVVVVLTALVFVLLAWRLGPHPALPAYLYLGGVGVTLAVIDMEHKRLPDLLTLPSYGVAAVLLGGAALVEGDAGPWLRALGGGAVLFAFYLLLLLVYPAGMGFGDVKLAGLVGGYLAWLGWGVLAVGAFLGFLLGGVAGISLILTRRATRKSALPFGPFMLAGALVGIVAGRPLVDAYLGLLP